MIDDCQTDEDQAERARLQRLYVIADEAIDAGMEVLPAAVWLKDDGTLDKSPLLPHGHLQAHRDRVRIRQELADPPNVPKDVPEVFEVVVGMRPGSAGFVVLDADVKHGKVGEAALKGLVAEHGDFLSASWRTPSGGGNVLLRKPPGAAYSNVTPWPGIDVRADGGWVVAPGNTCEGGAWEWTPGGSYSTTSDLPPGMAAQLRAPSEGGRKATNAETVAFIETSPTDPSLPAMQRFRDQLDIFKGAAKGSRHDALVRIVGWAFGMKSLDLRRALEQIRAEWLVLTAGEGREYEVNEVACWVAGQELAKRAAEDQQQAHDEPHDEQVRFRRYSVTELLAEDRTFHWDVVGMLAQRTYGVDAGELKTLKSYFGLARAVGLAAGVPVLGRWKVPERRRVLLYVAEGGRIPFTNRLERMAEAYELDPADLEDWLAVVDDVAPLNTALFRDHLTGHLLDFAPALVHLDPQYPFHPDDISPGQYTEVGKMLTATHRLCAEHDANFWVTTHMNQTGTGFDLKRISGAGHGEWGDSWALLKHRSPPDVDAGRFRLGLALGSRQWGGSTWDIDFNIGRFDADLGVHDGPISWDVQPAATGPAQAAAAAADDLAGVKVEILRVGRLAQKPMAKTAWLQRVGRRASTARAAFDELVADGEILQVGNKKPATFEVVRVP